MKTIKLDELKKSISDDHWKTVTEYLSGAYGAEFLSALTWKERNAVMNYLSDDGFTFYEPAYMQKTLESAIYHAESYQKPALLGIQYMLKNPRNLVAVYEANDLLEAAEQKMPMEDKLVLVQKFLDSDALSNMDEELNDIMYKHIEECGGDDFNDFIKGLIMDYREDPMLNFSVDEVCLALSEEYFNEIMEEINLYYADSPVTITKYDIAGNPSILGVIHAAFWKKRVTKMEDYK